MSKRLTLITFEATLAIENQDVNTVLEDFDGNVKSDGLHIVNKRGLLLSGVCLDSRIMEVIQGNDDEEDVVFSTKPKASYYDSTNQSFSYKDILMIDDHEYVVVKKNDELFLFSPTRLEMGLTSIINFSDIKSLEQLRDKLINVYPKYVVLRRVD